MNITGPFTSTAYSEPVYSCCEERGHEHRYIAPYFGLDGDPDLCGEQDPICQNTFQFHMKDSRKHLYSKHQLDAVRKEEIDMISLQLPDNPMYTSRSHLYAPNRKLSYFVDSKRYEPHIKEAVIGGLLPFERYSFQVFACNNYAGCSEYFSHFERTLRHKKADNVEFKAKLVNGTADGNTIVVQIRAPKFPNGATVAYHIQIEGGKYVDHVKCLTYTQMKATNNT